MITSVSEWVAFLRGSDVLMGIPLLAAGVGLLLFGWRMWKACVVISFCLIGLAIGATLVGPGAYQMPVAAGCALVLGVLSYRPANYSLAVLGGLVGGGFVINSLIGVGLHGPVLWIVGAVALFACSALAYLNRQFVVITVSAFLGAVLLMSGVAVFAMSLPALYGTMYALAQSSAFVLFFLLLVPTVMSCFYQVAEVHRAHAEL